MRVTANWISYPDWSACFRHRMETLVRLQDRYPDYKAALAATDGEQFIRFVSRTWSTDPERAAKVLKIHERYAELFRELPDARRVAVT